MRIYFSEGSDPMVTDSVSGFNVIVSRLNEFLSGKEKRFFVSADTSGSPAPYDTLLPSLEFEKGLGPIIVSRVDGSGLRITGSIENLQIWCSYFKFPTNAKDGDHNHPEHVNRPGYIDRRTLSVIIEVQNES